jgi:thiol-disulfide isomerase/thioredoxin
MKKPLIISGVVLLAVAAGVGVFYGYKKLHSKSTSASPITAEAATQEPAKPEVAKRAGEYVAYDPAKLAEASDGKVVLFFNAKWSKTCKMLDSDFKASVAKFPNNFTIMSVDYDKNYALRKQYAVPFEDTFVQVDAAGAMVNRWSGSETLDEVVALAR